MNNKAVIADIGGTNARFAICKNKEILKEKIISSPLFFKDPVKIAKKYLEEVNEDTPDTGVFAIAGPVLNGWIKNPHFAFSYEIKKMGEELGIKKFDIINDFAAQALCVPYLSENDFIEIGTVGKENKNNVTAVIGPGTGLGVGLLVPLKNHGYQVIATEGGHINAPLVYDNEIKNVLDILREILKEKGQTHISVEDIISGRGLPNLFKAVRIHKNKDASFNLTNPEITELMLKKDAEAVLTFDILFKLLGVAAGNYAIASGATGGVYLTGGILTVPEIRDCFLKSAFREYFENKGPASDYAKTIPTFLITHKNPAFLGLSGFAYNLEA